MLNNNLFIVIVLFNILSICFAERLFTRVPFKIDDLKDLENIQIPKTCNNDIECPVFTHGCNKKSDNSNGICEFTIQCNNQNGCVALNQKYNSTFYKSSSLYKNTNSTENYPKYLYMFSKEEETFKNETCKIDNECFSKNCKESQCVPNDKDPIFIFSLTVEKGEQKYYHGKAINEKCEKNKECITDFCIDKCETLIDSHFILIILFLGVFLTSHLFICVCIECRKCCMKRAHYYN
ncbi:hypothetical protein BCR36DRAFT_317019 [Piromyces finnis]|uniref:Uncharacterized protein n=1 Tax=Piromyces finnis TaxID=1754191 RepID=A0A1Y1VL36_9FUNG|nr:hypothetical protein BCR36DRAFT_317019 [Piromyces finnis]|eukprot:ORX59142.1 hypothetical protein BCR36DRAFT_317019 [Piromyces finnis]